MRHFLRSLTGRRAATSAQKDTETSLIEQFLYPKYGPGQMWERSRTRCAGAAARSSREQQVDGSHVSGDRITAVEARRRAQRAGPAPTRRLRLLHHAGQRARGGLDAADVPENVRAGAAGLIYRDFITVGLLVKKLKIRDDRPRRPRG